MSCVHTILQDVRSQFKVSSPAAYGYGSEPASRTTLPIPTLAHKKTRPKARFSWKQRTAYLDSTRAISRHLLE